MVQRKDAGIAAVVILHRGLQHIQHGGEVLFLRLHRNGLGVFFLRLEVVFLLGDVFVCVDAALILEGLLNQRLRVHVHRDCVGFDVLLYAVEFLDNGAGGHLHRQRADRTHQCQGASNAPFHKSFHLVFCSSLKS